MQAARRSSWFLRSSRHLQIRTNVTASQGKVRPYSEIPGPKPIPIFGNAWRFLPVIGTFEINNVLKWTQDLYNEFGDIVKISNVPGRKDMVILYNPESIEKVFRNEGPWPHRLPLPSFLHYRSKVRNDFFEGNLGIVTENDEAWHKARTIVNPPMMQPRVAKQYAGRIDQVAQDFIKRISTLRDNNQELPADFNIEIKKWALESIALVALDTRLGCLEVSNNENSDPRKMIEAVDGIFELSHILDLKLPIWKIFPTAPLKKYIHYSNVFLNISNKYVEKAREKMSDSTPEEEQSVLQKILKRDPSTKRAVIMAMDMIGAGIDTTSNTMATILYYLARNPESQEKLFSEVSKVIPAGPSDPLTSDNLDSMKYLKACIKEAIRLSPVFTGTMRNLPQATEIENYLIPANKVDVVMFSSALYRMEKHYPDANRYVPERWLRGDSSCPVTAQHKTHPFVYLPFGYGPRSCVGMRFANLEMETLVARMVRNYRLEWHHGEMTFISKILQMPNDPLKFKLIDRE